MRSTLVTALGILLMLIAAQSWRYADARRLQPAALTPVAWLPVVLAPSGQPIAPSSSATMAASPTVTATGGSRATQTTEPPPPSATRTPTASATPTATPPPGGIFNGNFELGRIVWTGYLDGIETSFVDAVTPASGQWAAVLEDRNTPQQMLTHDQVTVFASAPYLHYKVWIVSTETYCSRDVGGVFAAGAQRAFPLCTLTNTGEWLEQSLDLRAVAGQTITISLAAETNGTTPNSRIYFDDFSLQSTP